MKKVLVSLSVFVLVFSVLIGCSSQNKQSEGVGSSTSNTNTEQPQKKETVNLQFSIWGNEDHKKMYEDLLQEFKKENEHINVEIVTIPFTDYQQKLSIMVASKTAPDVGWLAERMIPQFIQSNQLVDISSHVKDDPEYDFADIYPSTLKLLTKDNALYGIPFSTPPSLIFFNKTLFEKHGLKTPLELYAEGKWNYEEFYKAAKTIADPANGVYGVKLIREWKNWADALLPLFWSHGADLFNAEGTDFILNSPEGRQALQFYYDMIFKDEVHPKPGDDLAFETGKIGMFTDRYSYVTKARAITDFEWDIAPMPEGVNGRGTSLGYAGYAVFETEHPQEAIELLKFLSGKEAMSVTSQYFVPSRKSILESDVFKKPGELPSPESIQIAVLDQMADARVAPGHPNWQQIDVKIQTLLDLLYTQSKSVEEILNMMEQQIDPLMKLNQ